MMQVPFNVLKPFGYTGMPLIIAGSDAEYIMFLIESRFGELFDIYHDELHDPNTQHMTIYEIVNDMKQTLMALFDTPCTTTVFTIKDRDDYLTGFRFVATFKIPRDPRTHDVQVVYTL